jgi:hypothetical protein
MQVVFPTDRHRGSFRVIESLYASSFNALGIEVVSEATPITSSDRQERSVCCEVGIVFHNTLGDGVEPLPDGRNVALPWHEWSRYTKNWADKLNDFHQMRVTSNHIRNVLLGS